MDSSVDFSLDVNYVLLSAALGIVRQASFPLVCTKIRAYFVRILAFGIIIANEKSKKIKPSLQRGLVIWCAVAGVLLLVPTVAPRVAAEAVGELCVGVATADAAGEHEGFVVEGNLLRDGFDILFHCRISFLGGFRFQFSDSAPCGRCG